MLFDGTGALAHTEQLQSYRKAVNYFYENFSWERERRHHEHSDL